MLGEANSGAARVLGETNSGAARVLLFGDKPLTSSLTKALPPSLESFDGATWTPSRHRNTYTPLNAGGMTGTTGTTGDEMEGGSYLGTL